MVKLNKSSLAVILILILSFIITPLSFAKSNLPAPFYRTHNLTLGYKTSKFFNGKDYQNNIQYSYYRKLFLGADNFQWKCGVSKNIAKASFDKAVNSGNLVIVQNKSSGTAIFGDKASTYESQYTIHFFWSEKKLSTQKLIWDNSNGYQFEDYSIFNRLSLALVPSSDAKVYCNFSNTLKNDYSVVLSHKQDSSSIQSQTSVFISDVKYELGRGLEGVDPDDLFIPQNLDERQQPDFLWTVDEKLKLNVTYMNNILEFNNSNPKLEPYLKWHWILRRSDENRSNGELLEDIKSPILIGYNHQLPSQGIYKLEVQLDDSALPLVLNPRPDFSWIKKRTFIIDANGQFRVGDTFSGRCGDDGVCVANPINCDDIKDVFRRVQCRMDKQFGFGVLNPSLLAFRRLISSFIISSNPSCGINITPLPGRFSSFNPQSVVADVCVRSRELRQKFSIMSVIVNFTASLFFLWLIVRIFNNLTNHRKDDMIGDI